MKRWLLSNLAFSLLNLWYQLEAVERRFGLSSRASDAVFQCHLRAELKLARHIDPEGSYGMDRKGVFIIDW